MNAFLTISTFVLVISFFVFIILKHNRNIQKREDEKKYLLKNGKPAYAVITDYKEVKELVTSKYNINIPLELQLLVKPNDGPEFLASTIKRYGASATPDKGDNLYVMYNPSDKSQVAIVTKNEFIAAGGALPSETVQAKF